MSSRVLAAAAALGCLLPALPARALPAPRKIVDYDIHASLDDGRRELTGRETLRWTNPSDVPVSELKLHLYWNAFRNNRSTFFRESGGKLRSDQADEEEGFGSIDLTSMTLGGVDLLRSARFESPDDGNRDDRTVLSVPLGAPVAPGESVALEIAWKSRIPKVFARAGYVRDFYMIGQWYPKVAVFEPRGRRRRS
ncbi:MAG: M1 family peptidase, partial [Holophagales bacterium]|nr:M1 family peptidase [Holophagales bacterium]